MRITLAALLATASAMQLPAARRAQRSVARPATTMVEAPGVAAPPKCPLNAESQLLAARDAVLRASEDGVARQRLRTLLPRGVSRELIPPDETWTGGIMQLYQACAPLVRDL